MLGYGECAGISRFCADEDGSDYDVWRVLTADGSYVLKKAKEYELDVYKTFFSDNVCGVPAFYGSVSYCGYDYFLMEYVNGENLRRCERETLTAALDALICLQDCYWERGEYKDAAYCYEDSLAGRIKRGEYLSDKDVAEDIKSAYDAFLCRYSSVPKTLCHDDLLPFNIIMKCENDAVTAKIIDWEYAGMLPYPTSLARLIAHGTEDDDAFFYMTEADREFAISYYYDKLVKSKGISYTEYRETLDYFLLYEYCEWIMLGIKYGDREMPRYKEYIVKAGAHVMKMRSKH